MYPVNKKLAEIFRELASIYRFKGSEHRFRVGAYEKAARVVEHLPEDVSHYMRNGDRLEELPGIGESIAEKIREYVNTGKIRKYEKLKKEIPADFIPLLEVKGIGPKTLKQIWNELNIDTREELVEALKDGRVEALDGFGEKTVRNMLEGLKEQEKRVSRIFLAEALEIANWLVDTIKSGDNLHNIEVAGSIRRGRETIGDIDLLASVKRDARDALIERFIGMEGIKHVLARGKTKASAVIEQKHRQVDLRIIDNSQWGAALLYFTGSKEHNIHLRKIAKDKGLKINEYGVYKSGSGKRIAGETEEEIYKKLGLQWIPPEMRENTGEIEHSASHGIPKLVTRPEILGDFHIHSDWSDGVNSIEELARFAKEEVGYRYMVLTDHSKSSRIAGGLDEQGFREQFKVIDEVNGNLGNRFVKIGVEVDILPDGTLDLEDDLLEQMEWVVASVHSHFSQDNTGRILAACEHPLVNAIGHPSGRLMGKRKPYPLDMEKVIRKAAKTGTALEINAQPERMDLSGDWAKTAREQGVMLVIGTDAHDLRSFDYMNQGVSTARRGWCEKRHILNTAKWKNVATFVKNKRENMGAVALS